MDDRPSRYRRIVHRPSSIVQFTNHVGLLCYIPGKLISHVSEDTEQAELHKTLIEQARRHRDRPTATEAKLWQHLRARQLDGVKFRRQQPIDRFIVDFCCLERCLVVEVDGPVHQHLVERDTERTTVLQALGYRVLRYTNDQVEHELATVLNAIREALAHT